MVPPKQFFLSLFSFGLSLSNKTLLPNKPVYIWLSWWPNGKIPTAKFPGPGLVKRGSNSGS